MQIYKYSAVYPCVKAIQSKLLGSADYEAFSGRSDLGEVFLYLFNRDLIFGIDKKILADLKVEAVEVMLKKDVFRIVRKMSRFLSGKQLVFLNFVLRTYTDFHNLRILIRNVSGQNIAFDEIQDQYLYFFPYIKERYYEMLRRISNLGQVFLYADQTVFKESFAFAADRFRRDNNLEIFENSLLFEFFNIVLDKAKILSGKDYKIASSYFDKITDTLNFDLVLRLKFILEKDLKEAKSKVIRSGLFKEDALLDSLYKLSLPEALSLINKKLKINAVNINELKQKMDLELLKFCKKNIRSNQFTIGPVLSILLLKKIEINNIIKILNGVYYGIDSAEIKDGLIVV